jgi:hypothetical protein
MRFSKNFFSRVRRNLATIKRTDTLFNPFRLSSLNFSD